ncbi:MAG: hypothetical protein LAN71_17785 [Acidobacteriia bacterium]|nr:hypothetical protein [Terriglobia bacterium]
MNGIKYPTEVAATGSSTNPVFEFLPTKATVTTLVLARSDPALKEERVVPAAAVIT